MNNEVTVRDVSTAADKKSSHAAIKAEIDAREDTFNNVIDSGEAMIKAGHFASNDVCIFSCLKKNNGLGYFCLAILE